jgi:prevent-host-death family protein
MPEVSATEAARKFADLLDRVEHQRETYTVVRRGHAVAEIHPIGSGSGAQVKAILRRHRRDTAWADELAEVRALLEVEDLS